MNHVRHSNRAVFKATACSLLLTALLGGCGKSDDPAALVAEAKQYQAKGDTKAAIIQLKNALQKNPEDAEARFLLGSIYMDSGDALSAEKELRKAGSLGIAPERLMPPFGKALMALGKYQDVLDQTAKGPDNAETNALRGDALFAMGKRDEAKVAFQKALERKPGYSTALIGLGKLAAVSGDAAGASKLADEAIAKNPKDGDGWMFRGDFLRTSGHPDEAIKAYDEAARLQPQNINPVIARAGLHIGARQIDAAKADIDAAKKIKPNSLVILYTQALLDFTQGRNAEALESLQLVLKAAPEHMPSLLLAGAVQYALGSTEQAEQNLKKYLAVNPDNLYARKLLASALLKNGQIDRASTIIADALKVAPQDPQLFMIAGESSLQKQDYAGATDYFEKAGALAPNVAMVHTALGMSKLGQGDNAKAVSELELAASLDTKSTKAGSLLVMTQLRLKQYDKALVSVKALEKDQPNDPQVQNLKGGVYLGLQDLPAARASFEKAVSLQPTYFPAVENLARLDLQEKHPEVAKTRFEAVLAADKKNVAAMLALGDLANAMNQPAEATTWFGKASAENAAAVMPAIRLGGQYLRTGAKDKALVLAQKLYATNDVNPAVLDFLGQAQATNNDLPSALATFKRLASIKPKSPEVQMRIASIHASMQNWKEATASLNNALAMQPENLEAQVALVSIYEAQGDFEAALKVVRTVKSQKPKLPAGSVLEGDILMAQKKPLLAQKAYEEGLAKGKGGMLALKVHAAMTAAGNGKEADARLASYVKETPADLNARMFQAGRLLARGENKAAIAEYEAIDKASPKNPTVLNNLAFLYQQEKDSRALDMAEQALKLAPNNPTIMDTLGWILVEKGPDKRGLDLLQKAGAQLPASSDVHLHLGIALMKSGDKAGARRELEPLAGSTTYAKADEAKRLLKDL